MRRLVGTAVAAMALSLALAGTALADNEQTGTTTITASVASGYTLTVPANTSIAFNATETTLAGDLTVRGNIENTEKVTVTATPGNLVSITGNGLLPYKLYKKGTTTEFVSEDWLVADVNGGGKEVDLVVAITEDAWKAAPAGEYQGVITFKAKLTNAS